MHEYVAHAHRERAHMYRTSRQTQASALYHTMPAQQAPDHHYNLIN
jgi:hypothetical protein